VTWVLQGSLVHQDSTGHAGVIYPGLAQHMSAGAGILHSEKNDSWRLQGGQAHTDPVHFVQMWVVPDEDGITPGYEQLEIENDLLAGGRKLCGILAETVEGDGGAGRACVVGIGINLTESAYPAELRGRATSVESAAGARPDREALLAALVRSLARRYEQLQNEGGEAETVGAWAAASSFAEGRRVRVVLGDETFDGTTRGVEPDGALRVETDARETRIVRAGDVTSLRSGE